MYHCNPLSPHVLHKTVKTEVVAEFASPKKSPDKVNDTDGAGSSAASTAVDQHGQGLAGLAQTWVSSFSTSFNLLLFSLIFF